MAPKMCFLPILFIVAAFWSVELTRAEPSRVSTSRDRPSAGQVREKLRVELGPGFELATTQRHFVVAVPTGQRDRWSPRFEEFYNNFYLYFSVRGIKMSEPPEPLTVIVFPSQNQFQRYATSEGVRVVPGLLGYYSPRSNRVAMFDLEEGHPSQEGWAANGETLIHELAHQIAFNTGVHSRRGSAPQWVVEGLGTLFEARGVWRSRDFRTQSDRVNRGRWRDYGRYQQAGNSTAVASLIESDELFASDPGQAYAYAWAMTFYLTETQPRKYSEYLQHTARRMASAPYSAAERRKDFAAIFGQDVKMFERRLTRYLQDVK